MYMAPKTPPVMTGATTTYETNDIHLDGVAMAAWNDGQIDHVLAHNPRGLNSLCITHSVEQPSGFLEFYGFPAFFLTIVLAHVRFLVIR